MEFGPEIKVDGKRPEWLGSYDGPLGYERNGYGWYGPMEGLPEFWNERDIISSRDGWRSIIAIRLPANHPHYTTPTPDERAVAPELVGRMRKLVEAMALSQSCTTIYTEARAIVAALEPVDPDVAEADAIMAMDEYKGGNNHVQRAVIAAIKRGRQLEKEGK